MARLLVQLKLRLLRNALRASNGAKVGFIASTVLAVVAAVVIFIVLARLRGHSAAVDLTTVIFTVVAFGWLILPLVMFGLDSTLDPATLALYPLRTRPLAGGLLAASATGAWPAANVIGLLGVTIGLASGGFGVFIAVIAVLLQVMFCITLARFVTTALAGMLRSRRGKDFAVLLILPIFALYEGFIQIVPRLTAEGKLTAASFAGVDTWLRWIPPGLAAHAIQDASDGHPGPALLRLAMLAAIIVALGWLWVRSLSRALVTADTTTQSAAGHGTAVRPVRPARHGGRPVLDLPAPRSAIAHLLGHHRDHHGGRIGQHRADPALLDRPDHQRLLRRRVRRRLPRQRDRDERAGLRPGGYGAERPTRYAGLLLRAGPRDRSDRGAAAHRGLLRLGRGGQASGGRFPGHGGGPGRDRRGPGPGQHLLRRQPLPGREAVRHPHAAGGRRVHGPVGRGDLPEPDRRAGGGPADHPRRHPHRHGADGDPDAAARAGRRGVRPGADLRRRGHRRPGG